MKTEIKHTEKKQDGKLKLGANSFMATYVFNGYPFVETNVQDLRRYSNLKNVTEI